MKAAKIVVPIANRKPKDFLLLHLLIEKLIMKSISFLEITTAVTAITTPKFHLIIITTIISSTKREYLWEVLLVHQVRVPNKDIHHWLSCLAPQRLLLKTLHNHFEVFKKTKLHFCKKQRKKLKENLHGSQYSVKYLKANKIT